MFIKDGTYRSVDVSGLTAPILEGTVLTSAGAVAAADGSDAFGIVPETVFVMPPTKMVNVVIGGTIDLQDPANANVTISKAVQDALSADINFIPGAGALPVVDSDDDGKFLVVEDGKWSAGGETVIVGAVSDWLDDHPEATTTVEDGAVTTAKLAAGAVTDAKLAQNGGVLSEVHDVRIGDDGTVYESAGAAVRGQFGDFKNTMSVVAGEKFAWDIGQTRDIGTVLTPTSYSNWCSVLVNAKEGDIFFVKGSGGSNSRLWIFADSTGANLLASEGQVKTSNYIKIVAPANTSYLVCNSRTNDEFTPDLIKIVNSQYSINSETAENAGYTELDTLLIPITGVNGTATSGGVTWKTSGYVHTAEFDDNTSATGQYYARIAWDIKPLFGTGTKLLISLTNDNGSDTDFSNSNWYFNEWHLAGASNHWTTNIKTLSSLPAESQKRESTFVIDIDTDLSDVNPDNYNNVFLLVAAFKSSPSNVTADKLSITIKILNNNTVLATKLIGFDPTEYYKKTEVDDLIDGSASDVDLLFWGDSLTAGAGGDGTNYPAVCATELGGITYKNCGVGGETANTIAARQGGNNIMIPSGAVNGDYETLSDVFGSTVAPLLQGNGSGSGNKLVVNGYECNLSYANGTYTISDYTGPSLIVPAFARFAGSKFTGKVVCIFVGQNGSTFTGLSGVNAQIAIIDSMIKHIGHDRYVVLGLTTGTSSSRDAEDNQMLAHYGNKFFPTRELLVDYGLAINGLSPTTQDETDIASGTVPTSLRSDGTHMNAYGYTAIGKMLANKIKSLGYV